jgi:antitoxin MazE
VKTVKTRVQKWGNSLALRIPKSFAAEVGLDPNSLVVLLSEKPKFTLKQLLAQANEKNLHHEFDTGSAAGGEVWLSIRGSCPSMPIRRRSNPG